MKFSVRDFRAIKSADIEASPIALLVGINGAGKSSMALAISAVVTGATVPAGMAKGEAGQLVHTGAASASVEASFEHGKATATWPKCDRRTEGQTPFVSMFAAGLLSITGMDARQRSNSMGTYLKSKPTKEDLATEMAFAPGLVAKVWESVEKDGWDAAWKHATDRGAKLKGQWEGVTGEQWGSAKGGKWIPDGWSEDLRGASEQSLQEALTGATVELDEANKAEGRREQEEAHLQSTIDAAEGLDISEMERAVAAAESIAAAAQQVLEDTIAAEASLAAAAKPAAVDGNADGNHAGWIEPVAPRPTTHVAPRQTREIIPGPVAPKIHREGDANCPHCGAMVSVSHDGWAGYILTEAR